MQRFIDQRLGSPEVATVTHELNLRRGFLGWGADILLLRQARAALTSAWQAEPPKPDLPVTDVPQAAWQEISEIWREVVEQQRADGGDITFVYIPAHYRFLAQHQAAFQALEQKVVRRWAELGVPYVSLTKLLETTGNPLAYYGRHDLHFNPEGYRLTSEAIAQSLARSGG
jgi:hypothetical protein